MQKLDPSTIPSPEEALSIDSSRYKNVPKVVDPLRGLTTLKLYRNTSQLYSNISDYTYYVVTPRSAHRPDLVSYVVYDNPSYWWVVLEANNLSGIEDVKAGMTLRIPDLFQLETYTDINEDIFA